MARQKGNDVKAEVFLPDDYTPAEDEPFMNDRQTEYFRRKLLNWKAELMGDSKSTIEEFLACRITPQVAKMNEKRLRQPSYNK